jgi:hypothetical protein
MTRMESGQTSLLMAHWHSSPSPHSPPFATSVRVHTMDLPPAWSQACICGRVFSLPQALSCHQRSCPRLKKRLSSALEKAKEVWQSRKRRKAEVDQNEALEGSSNQNDTSCPSPVEVLNYTCVHPEVRLCHYQQHLLLIGSCSECRDLWCKPWQP